MHLLRVYCFVSPAILERVHFWSRRVTQRDGISKPSRETRTFRHQILMWLSVTDISISCSLRVFTTGNTPQGGEANLPTKKIQNNIEEKNPNVLQKVWKEMGQWLWSNPLCTDTVSKRWTRIVPRRSRSGCQLRVRLLLWALYRSVLSISLPSILRYRGRCG